MTTALTHTVPQIVLVVGAAIVLVTALFVPRGRQWVAAPLALLTLAVSAVTTVGLADLPPQRTFMGLWALDGLTLWGTVAITLVTALVVLMSPEWFATDARHGEYYSVLLLGALGASLLAGASDLNQLVVAVVLSTVTGYVLASYHRRSALSAEAGIKYFLVGALTNALLLVGVVLLYGLGGTTRYADLGPALDDAGPLGLVAVLAFVGVGLAFKVGATPAHVWMPDVAEGAPVPAAAFLTTVPKIGGLIALLRVVELLPEHAVGWRPAVALVAALTMTVGNLAALWQDDVRRLLGWSSVSQSGYALLAVVAVGRSEQALPALLLFVVGYGVANVAAFAVVAELRGRTALADYGGLGRARPWLGATLTIAMLSLTGIPPLIGFALKLELFTAVLDAGYGWLAFVAVVNTVVSLAYYLRVVAAMYLSAEVEAAPVLGRSAAVAAGLGLALVVALGLLAGALLTAIGPLETVP